MSCYPIATDRSKHNEFNPDDVVDEFAYEKGCVPLRTAKSRSNHKLTDGEYEDEDEDDGSDDGSDDENDTSVFCR
jgi:hypothetical protein